MDGRRTGTRTDDEAVLDAGEGSISFNGFATHHLDVVGDSATADDFLTALATAMAHRP